ncbi:DUF302 domain-containing protein [Alloacidobacterium sp.]|uniref:DUF302 domain-containing protein n=1 Tax=Alloacidobacterium sp. TaxID=2951999 RepID=UPI002D723BED|nr:DUF302 domain-containing protein [Alloacidobacterium sp.]HYK34879.1 DUF302 domain-containing protein [Alloacidobacterium sp.]
MTDANGMVSIPSRYSVDEIVARLENLLWEKGIKLFALIDHSGEAEKAGLKMPPTKVAIFGNPKAGTPLMTATPSIAIDLPLKLLIAQDADRAVSVSWNAPAYLASRHRLPQEFIANIAVIEKLAAAIAG